MANKHRKRGDWLSVVKSRSGKQRQFRETARCPWGCGHLYRTDSGSLSSHLSVCQGNTKRVKV